MKPSYCFLALALLLPAAAQQRNRTDVWADENIKSIVNRVEEHIDAFENALHTDLDNSRLNGSHHEDWINNIADEMQDAADDMKKQYGSRNERDFTRGLDDAMVAGNALNRAMLHEGLAKASMPLWVVVREDLNKIASAFGRRPIANVVVVTFVPATAAVIENTDVRQVMDRLEASTDRFREKFKKTLDNSTANLTKRERIWNRWADELEHGTDELLSEWKEKDYKEVQEELETTLIIASALDRIMMDSNFDATSTNEWNEVKRDLNRLAQAFTYPIL